MAASPKSVHAQSHAAQQMHKRAGRALKALSATNHALVRATDESKLVVDVCQLIVDVGGYRLAWVGYAGHDKDKSMRVMAHAGQDGGYVGALDVTWAETEWGRGPMGTAIRTGRPSVAQDIAKDESIAPWRKEALRNGYGSCIAFPLLSGSNCMGGISIYAAEPDAFDADETSLLSELAEDVAFGMATLRAREEHARAMDALRRSEALCRNLVETTGALVVIVDRTERRTFASTSATEELGRSGEQFLGGTFGDTMVPEDGEKARALVQEVFRTGRPVRGYVARHQVAQKTKHVIWNFEILKDAREEVVAVQATGLDITEQRHLEEQYYQAQKMESVGRLAGGVAHDFNNVLTAIMGYTELCADALPSNNSARQYLKEIQAAGQRAAKLTRQLLVFSRQQAMEPKVVNPNELVANISQMLRRLIRENVSLSIAGALDVWQVKADPGRLEQVIVNLVVNASDAMPEGGKLVIETAKATLDEEYCASHHGVTPGEYVLISVSDTGIGMPEEVKAHLFEPFFTTKPHGTGLGLSTCYGIVKQMGGHIWAYSEVGHGTTMKVYLPRIADDETPQRDQAADDKQAKGTETVMVIEDESSVRRLVVSTLRHEGYAVLEADSGHNALRVVHEHSGPIHLFLCDLILPEIEGRELVRQLGALHPEARVVFTSGYPEHVVAQRGMLESSTSFLQKPFSYTQLASTVKDALVKGISQTRAPNGAAGGPGASP